jgi:hypothetical protein
VREMAENLFCLGKIFNKMTSDIIHIDIETTNSYDSLICWGKISHATQTQRQSNGKNKSEY